MLNTDYKDDILTVFLSGEIDHNRAVGIRSAIDSQINALRPRRLELDFSDVSFMDSSGIGLIMGRYRAVGLIGGDLRIINVPDNLNRIIELSGVTTLGVLR
ncbi:MAG: anti-sigma factor antagonist [Ruminococcus sp.]|jgi:stage II sporulation protein AA (anti-sigma F factor antagonist)|nr:anti-sigma factor antagonist [Ruminococcus sp.]